MTEYKMVPLTENPGSENHMLTIRMKPCPRSVKIRLYGKDAVLCNEMEHQKQSNVRDLYRSQMSSESSTKLPENPSSEVHMLTIRMKPCPRSVNIRLYGKDTILCNEMEHQKQPNVRDLYRPPMSSESSKKIVTVSSYEEASKLTCPVISGLYSCAICEKYTTKVLKNMKCHMIMHKEGLVLYYKDIVNPIPRNKVSLESALLSDHFTMPENKGNNPSTQQKQSVNNNVDKNEPLYCVPDFVPLNLRFKCGSKTCNFYARGHKMLKEHMKTVHPRMHRFNCPHCSSTITPDVVDLHLRYHKYQLFKCGHCKHLHYQRAGIEHHSKEEHAGEECQIEVVRDLVTTERKNMLESK